MIERDDANTLWNDCHELASSLLKLRGPRNIRDEFRYDAERNTFNEYTAESDPVVLSVLKNLEACINLMPLAPSKFYTSSSERRSDGYLHECQRLIGDCKQQLLTSGVGSIASFFH